MIAKTVDARGLVVGIGDGAQAGVGEQRHQRRPVPDVHHQHGEPGVARAAGVSIGRAKAIVGRDIFTHESGIHVAGLLSDVRSYQALDPTGFGRRKRIAMGKHSGLAAVRSVCAGLALDAAGEQAVLRAVKAEAIKSKAAVPPLVVRAMAKAIMKSRAEQESCS